MTSAVTITMAAALDVVIVTVEVIRPSRCGVSLTLCI